jgi:hypothetical protein
MHLQYQPAPPPQPQMAGPGGAYGPMQQSPQQPVPGQLPPAGMSMRKPGTITGIQVILWIFLAISAIANLFSVISMVEFFNPFSLIGLAFAVYSTIQSLASGIHITRGKRWAWIWSLISAILGIVLSTAGILFGLIYIDAGGDMTLLIAVPLAALYWTLLGLLCSKSARQWILMHRIQRGEVQVPGMGGGMAPLGGMQGMAPLGMVQGGAAAPQRPETRPGAVNIAAVVLGLLAAMAAWQIWLFVRSILDFLEWARENGTWSSGSYSFADELFSGAFPQSGVWIIAYSVLVVCAAITIPALLKGSAFGRIFGFLWSIPAIIVGGYAVYLAIDFYNTFIAGTGRPVFSGPDPFGWYMTADIAFATAALAVFVFMLVPGVKAWTPTKPSAPLIMMVPMGQPQMQQQPGPYGQPPQQQQPPYPPQY